MPQSAATTERPPSVTMSSTGASLPGRADQPAQVPGVGEVLAAVDQDQVDVGGLEQGAALGGQDLDLVGEQGQGRQDVGRGLGRAGQQQQGAHGISPIGVRADSPLSRSVASLEADVEVDPRVTR